jgi:hypothetical protein
VALRPWALARRPGYPPERAILLLRRGAEAYLPPLDRHRVLLDLARRNIARRSLGGRV